MSTRRGERSGPAADLWAMLDAMPVGIVSTERDGRIRLVNARAQELLEVAAEEAQGRAFVELFEPESRDEIRCGKATVVSLRTGSGGTRLLEVDGGECGAETVYAIHDLTDRIHAEQQREEESGVSLRLALDAGRMGSWRWDEATNVVRWDELLERIYGLEPRTFGGTFSAFLDLVHPEDRLFVIEQVGQAGSSGPDYEIEFRIIRPDGALRWISDRGRVLFGEGGKRCGITGVCWDCTEERMRRAEREQLTAQVQAAHALLDTLFDNAPVGLGFWDRDLRFVKVNRALAEINGVSAEAHIGKTIPELLPGIDGGMDEALRHVAETGEAVLKQEAHGYTPAKPDALRHWSVSYYPIRLGGEIAGVGAVCEEITERKATEQRLADLLASEIAARSEAEAAEERAAFLAEAATVLSSSLDFHATLAAVARLAVPRMADWCAVDMIEGGERKRLAVEHVDAEKVKLAHELHRRFPPGENDPLVRVLQSGEAELMPEISDAVLDAIVVDADHRRIVRELGLRSYLMVPIKHEDEVLGTITFVSAESGLMYGAADLRLAKQLAGRAGLAIQNARLYAQAEQRRVEAETAIQGLQRANADLEEFAYVASHDLQEPLRTIASYTQLLEREYRGQLDEAADEHIRKVVNGVTRMRDLIRDLLDYSRVSRSEDEPEGTVLLDGVVERCKEALRASIEESRAELECESLPEVGPADGGQMEQLMMNLLSNAIKYRRPGVPPRIRVRAKAAGEWWRLEVEDNGQGFAPELSNRLFGIFKRLHGREVPGTGIGLALCRRIVERHGGKITAEGRPGEGATFCFTLPRVK
jgi:PAS domain S-box-containing protein